MVLEWIRAISFYDYLLIILAGTLSYFLFSGVENRVRNQRTVVTVLVLFGIRILYRKDVYPLIRDAIADIGFGFFWIPFSISIFIFSLYYDKSRPLNKLVQVTLLTSMCLSGLLYLIVG